MHDEGSEEAGSVGSENCTTNDQKRIFLCVNNTFTFIEEKDFVHDFKVALRENDFLYAIRLGGVKRSILDSIVCKRVKSNHSLALRVNCEEKHRVKDYNQHFENVRVVMVGLKGKVTPSGKGRVVVLKDLHLLVKKQTFHRDTAHLVL